MQKAGIALVILLLGIGGLIFPEEGKNFTVTVDIDASLFQYKENTYGSERERKNTFDKKTVEHLPFGGFEMINDTSVSFSYEGKHYGGNISLDDKDGIGGIKVWGKFGSVFKITAGDDIGAGYADSLDADPGMRVYTGVGSVNSAWDASTDPDNITQDKGVLLELFIKSFTLALAGQYYDGSTTGVPVYPSDNDYSVWETVDQKKYGYGARLGWDSGDWGKFNVSYINQYNNSNEGDYGYDLAARKVVPVHANSETNVHMFGAYASLKIPLVPGLAFSLGYSGVYTKYLDEFYQTAGATGMIETLVPSVYQQGFNFNARYTGIPKLTLRTDHNYSFWTDRDYTVFHTSRGNYGLDSNVEGAALADVDHWLLWNGVGAAYQFTGSFKLSLYIRNLYRQDAASGNETSWKVNWDKLVGELTATFKPFGDNAEFYVGFTLERQEHFSSKEVNTLVKDWFASWAAPSDTTDVELVYKIPVGMIIKLQ
jgi:hypothetical protein